MASTSTWEVDATFTLWRTLDLIAAVRWEFPGIRWEKMGSFDVNMGIDLTKVILCEELNMGSTPGQKRQPIFKSMFGIINY